jgi:LemA protein
MNLIFGILVLLLLASGLFDVIDWKFNLVAIGVLVVIWLVTMYNHFVSLRNRSEEAWADIEVQLKRRYDLIPNLVNTVKGYATHESAAFENVTKARSAAMGVSGPTQAHAAAENMLAGALKSLFAVSEAYPDLKANQNFLALQNELSDTENKIQASRRFYNTNVRDLNTAIESFPSNIIAAMFKFVKKEFFDLPDADAAQSPVEVKF